MMQIRLSDLLGMNDKISSFFRYVQQKKLTVFLSIIQLSDSNKMLAMQVSFELSTSTMQNQNDGGISATILSSDRDELFMKEEHEGIM